MKNNLLPSLVMLLAGLVCSIISLRQGVDLMSFTTRLLTVLVVFYIIGAILKVILSAALFVVWSFDDAMDSFIERVASSCENVAICAT